MPLYRVSRKDNPSERFEEEFDDVVVAGGLWAFGRSDAGSAGDVVASWSTSDWKVEVEDHGDVWREIDPDISEADD